VATTGLTGISTCPTVDCHWQTEWNFTC